MGVAPAFAAVAALSLSLGSAPGAEEVRRLELDPLEVIGVAPLAGLDPPLERVPANVRSLDPDELEALGGATLPDLLVDVQLPSALGHTEGFTVRGHVEEPLVPRSSPKEGKGSEEIRIGGNGSEEGQAAVRPARSALPGCRIRPAS